MTKEELNLEELDKANGGYSSGAYYQVITYKDNKTDTETKEEWIKLSITGRVRPVNSVVSAKVWCSEKGKIFVSSRLEEK